MADSSDDFFSSFESNAQPVRRVGPPTGGPPPPLVTRRAAPPPPPQKQQQATAPRAPPPPRVATVPGANTATSLRRPQQPPQKQNLTNAGPSGGIRPPTMSNYNPTTVSAPSVPQMPVVAQQPLHNSSNQLNSSGSDWYSPPSQEQHASFQYQQPIASSAPYVGGNTANNAYGTPQIYPMSTPATTPFMAPSAGSQGGAMFLPPQPSMMMPPYNSSEMNMNTIGNFPTTTPSRGYNDLDDFSNEPPLLEELGVNVEHIIMKTKAVVVPFRRFAKHNALVEPSMIVEDADLAGPLAFALLLGGELLLAGKLQFGYIYGFGMFGCLSMTLILNLMTPGDTAISFWTVTSILGYALLPVNILAALKLVLLNLAGFLTVTQILALLTVIWSTTASTRLLEVGCGMEAQRYLVAYPIAMLYSAFVLITIF